MFQENPVLKKISLLNLTIPWYPERCKSKMPVGMVSYSCDEELLILSIPHKTKQKMKGTGHLISNKPPIIECVYILSKYLSYNNIKLHLRILICHLIFPLGH